MSDQGIELTGNPFVDTGIAVISSLARLDDINRLTLSHFESVFGDGSQLTEWNSKLKAFSQVFGTNNPLFHPSFGFRRGQGPSETNKTVYRNTLKGLLSAIADSGRGPRCWACGSPSNFDFADICKKAVEAVGRTANEEKWVGRDWFPLAGSLGSDAQALPAASSPPHICPKCLFAVHYLPMGLMLVDGRPAVFQCSTTEFWYDLCDGIVNEVRGRVQSGNNETLGSKEGSRAVVERLLLLFERIQRMKGYQDVPEGTTLYVWRFSNSGASPECSIEEIPNPALVFLWDAAQKGLGFEIESLVGAEGKNRYFSLFRCILDKRDYSGLYPDGKRRGASLSLYTLYQTCIRGHSSRAVQIAHKLARQASIQESSKGLKRLQRREAFKERELQNQIRAIIVQMSERGEINLDDYLGLFPRKEEQGITVEWDGWDLIRFCLHHASEEFPRMEERVRRLANPNKQLSYYSAQIYNYYLSEKGRERFTKEVLLQIPRKMVASWLRSRFVQLAESKEGFTYGHWSNLCKLSDGRIFVAELLFQMRLLWTQWIYENRDSISVSPSVNGQSTDGLSQRLRELTEAIFLDYVNRRGLDRFHRDVLMRLRRREIGFVWLKNKLMGPKSENVQPLSEEEWENFIIGDEGQDAAISKTFQIHLALANLYRENRFTKG